MKKDYIYPFFILVIIATVIAMKPWQVASYPPEFIVQNFKCLQQPDHITCGPTSGTMLLNHYNISATIKEVEKRTRTHWLTFKGSEIGMTAPDYLASALNDFGLAVSLEMGNLDKLRQYVSQNRPAIVLLRSGRQLWHYVVVIGYDKDNIFVADPGYGSINKLAIETFKNAWSFYGDMADNKYGLDFYYLLIRGSDITGNMLIAPKAPNNS